MHTSLTLKLNAPSALLHDFLCAWYRADDASPPFCFPLTHDGIGSAAFLLHEGEGICAKGGEHLSLLPCEGIRNNPPIFPFLKQLCPLATTGQSKDKEDGKA